MSEGSIILLCSRIDAHAGVILDIVRQYDLFKIIGFLDDDPGLRGKEIAGVPVLGTIRSLESGRYDADGFFICTGNNDVRARLFGMLKESGKKLVNIIPPSAVVSRSATLGEGVFIGAQATVTHNVKIGNGVIINTAASVDHDNVIEDFVNVCPGCHTSGRVVVRRGAFLGTGVSVIPDVTIGENAIVGAGSVVIRNVESGSTVAGNPAKTITSRKKES